MKHGGFGLAAFLCNGCVRVCAVLLVSAICDGSYVGLLQCCLMVVLMAFQSARPWMDCRMADIMAPISFMLGFSKSFKMVRSVFSTTASLTISGK